MKEDPRHIRISEFNYPLPDERIAKFPLSVRDQSKLLLYRHGEVSEDRFTSLPEYLPSGSLMIFNNTKVIQARLHFRKETGALIEVFCLGSSFHFLTNIADIRDKQGSRCMLHLDRETSIQIGNLTVCSTFDQNIGSNDGLTNL